VPNLRVVAAQADALREKWERKAEEIPERGTRGEERLIAESAAEDLENLASNLSKLARADGLPTRQNDR
jgi:hypothetical protein